METALIVLVVLELMALAACRVAGDSGRARPLAAVRVAAVAVGIALLVLAAVANRSS